MPITETDLPIIVFCKFIDVSPIISATNNGRRTKLPPSEPSRYDESNDGSFVFLPSFDTEIISKTSINSWFIDVLPIISASIGDRRTEPPLFDSSHRDGSNGSSYVLLPLFVAEIIGETSINLQKTIIGKSVSVIGIYLSVSVINKTETDRFR